MHFFTYHIGDYAKDTRYLTRDQDLAYRRLLDWYYNNEQPIPTQNPADIIGFGDIAEDVEHVLKKFFTLTETGWRNTRADREIAEFHAKSDKAKRAAAKRWHNEGNADAMRTHTERNANQEPITNNQEPITNLEPYPSKDGLSETAFPTCPHQDIINLYHKHLPMLTRVRDWSGNRQGFLAARWRWVMQKESLADRNAGVEWWDGFFKFCALSPFLRGDGPPRRDGTVWKPDLEWIVRPSNFIKIIERKYHDQKTVRR